MELTKEKSEQLAFIIETIKQFIPLVDLEYAKAVASAMLQQSQRQDTLAVLNPRYNPEKSNLIALQANALKHFVAFIEAMVECNKMKENIACTDRHYATVEQMFL